MLGTYICQCCNNVKGHFEDEKVTTLYISCTDCPTEEE